MIIIKAYVAIATYVHNMQKGDNESRLAMYMIMHVYVAMQLIIEVQEAALFTVLLSFRENVYSYIQLSIALQLATFA